MQIVYTTQLFPSTPTHLYTNHTPKFNNTFHTGQGRNDSQACVTYFVGKTGAKSQGGDCNVLLAARRRGQ